MHANFLPDSRFQRSAYIRILTSEGSQDIRRPQDDPSIEVPLAGPEVSYTRQYGFHPGHGQTCTVKLPWTVRIAQYSKHIAPLVQTSLLCDSLPYIYILSAFPVTCFHQLRTASSNSEQWIHQTPSKFSMPYTRPSTFSISPDLSRSYPTQLTNLHPTRTSRVRKSSHQLLPLCLN
jgi:hypothetical protein